MAHIGGKSAAIYSPVSQSSSYIDLDNLDGESYYKEDNQLYIKDGGYISQNITGANNNEIWLLSADGKGNFKISLTFVDYNSNAIYTTSELCNNDRIRYFSTYGVAPKNANGVFIRIKGDGVIDSIRLQHLKALVVLSGWKGELRSEGGNQFEASERDKYFQGEANSVRYLDGVPDTDTFQKKEKIFIGFLGNKSLFNRIEGRISKINNLSGPNASPVKFRCDSVKIPFKE